jgi:hypothetical protein
MCSCTHTICLLPRCARLEPHWARGRPLPLLAHHTHRSMPHAAATAIANCQWPLHTHILPKNIGFCSPELSPQKFRHRSCRNFKYMTQQAKIDCGSCWSCRKILRLLSKFCGICRKVFGDPCTLHPSSAQYQCTCVYTVCPRPPDTSRAFYFKSIMGQNLVVRCSILDPNPNPSLVSSRRNSPAGRRLPRGGLTALPFVAGWLLAPPEHSPPLNEGAAQAHAVVCCCCLGLGDGQLQRWLRPSVCLGSPLQA